MVLGSSKHSVRGGFSLTIVILSSGPHSCGKGLPPDLTPWIPEFSPGPAWGRLFSQSHQELARSQHHPPPTLGMTPSPSRRAYNDLGSSVQFPKSEHQFSRTRGFLEYFRWNQLTPSLVIHGRSCLPWKKTHNVHPEDATQECKPLHVPLKR